VTESYGPSSVGKNFKKLGEKLQSSSDKSGQITTGSKIRILSGTHEGLRGKVVALIKNKSS
jgi:hypothetical protein